MKKKINYLVFTVVLSLAFVFTVSAASFSVSANKSSVVVGNTVKVTVKVSGAAGWEYCVNYDSSLFTLTSAGSDTGGKCVKTGSTMTGYSNVTYTFKARQSGSGTFSLSGAQAYNDDGDTISSSKGSVSVSAKTQAEIEANYSNNANLSGLRVEGYTITPSFSSSVTNYSLEVENDVESIVIRATKADGNASVSGTGERSLSEGSNVFRIVVTAQKGNTKTYTLVVNRKELDPINVTVDGKNYTVIQKADSITAPNYYTGSTVEIDGKSVPAFVSDVTKFTLVGLKDEEGNIGLFIYDNGSYKSYKQITIEAFTFIPLEAKEELDGYDKKETINIKETTVDVYNVDEDGEFVLIYGMNAATGKTDWYKYDTKEGTFQRFVDSKGNVLAAESKNEKNIYFYLTVLFAILSCISIILVISLIAMNSKLRKKNSRLIKMLPKEEKVAPDLDLDDDGVDDFEVEDFEEEPKKSKTEKKTKKEEIEEKLSETEEIRKMQEDFLSTRENNVIDGDTDILEELLEVDGESVQEVPAPEPKTRKKKTTKKIDYRRTKRKKK
jgi:hypothetical protein